MLRRDIRIRILFRRFGLIRRSRWWRRRDRIIGCCFGVRRLGIEQLAELNVDEQHIHGFGPTGLLKDLAFSPDGKLLAVTVGDDIWWVDLPFFDQQISDLRHCR